jgi:hypothetical protein
VARTDIKYVMLIFANSQPVRDKAPGSRRGIRCQMASMIRNASTFLCTSAAIRRTMTTDQICYLGGVIGLAALSLAGLGPREVQDGNDEE